MEELKQKLQRLLENSEWSPEDRKWLLEYLESNDTSALQQLMQQQFSKNLTAGHESKEEWARQILEQIHYKIKSANSSGRVFRLPIWKRVAGAAAVLILLATGVYFYLNRSSKVELAKKDRTVPSENDLPPGGNKAVLTLANGSIIILDSAQNGTIAQQGSANIIKEGNGQIAYTNAELKSEVFYNTLSTPRGGEYKLVLPDGSKVWLNAASSIRFPNVFTGNQRKVEITGEAYFEVTKNTAMPFKVAVNGMEVEVLGTHFDVMAYDDEAAIKTTLAEGKVKISNGSNKVMLSPSQQAKLGRDNNRLSVETANVDKELAWVNGLFDFENDAIDDIMRQLSRWYNVEVIYTGEINKHYSGTVRRQTNVSEVLHMLEMAGGVKFSVEGKRITVRAN